MTRTTIFARDPQGAFAKTVEELNIHRLLWLNGWMIAEHNDDGEWTENPDFLQHLHNRTVGFPVGSSTHPRVGFDLERWQINSPERLKMQQGMLIKATNHFVDKVQFMFYGLPFHKRMWITGSKLDWLYQLVIEMQGAIWLCLYSRGTGPAWFRQDMAAATRLLRHARNIAKGKPIICSVSGRRSHTSGWERISDSQIELYFQFLVRAGCAELNVFGDLNHLQVVHNGAASGKWPITDIPTDEEYEVELATVTQIAHSI